MDSVIFALDTSYTSDIGGVYFIDVFGICVIISLALSSILLISMDSVIFTLDTSDVGGVYFIEVLGICVIISVALSSILLIPISFNDENTISICGLIKLIFFNNKVFKNRSDVNLLTSIIFL